MTRASASFRRAVSLLATVTALSAEAGSFVEIRAHIDVSTYEEDEPQEAGSSVRTFSFVCIVGTNRWRVETDYLKGAISTWFFDGTNVFEAIRPVAPTSERLRDDVQARFGLATVPFEIARSNLTITVHASSDGHPHGHLGVNLPWLAFCSGTYLQRDNRLVGLPDAILRHAPDGFAHFDKTKTFPDPLGLPETIELFTSKSLSETSVQREQFRGKRDVKVWQGMIAGIPDGALKFRYSVEKATNFLNRRFPLEFAFVHNAQRKNGTWFVARRGKGAVSSLRESAPPEHVFNTSLQQTVVDYRFSTPSRPNDSLLYQSTNAFLPATRVEAQKMTRVANANP